MRRTYFRIERLILQFIHNNFDYEVFGEPTYLLCFHSFLSPLTFLEKECMHQNKWQERFDNPSLKKDRAFKE